MTIILKFNAAAIKAAMEADKEVRAKRRKSKNSSGALASDASGQ
jgi:hypothetical protein